MQRQAVAAARCRCVLQLETARTMRSKSHSVRAPPVSMLLQWAGGSGVTSTLAKLLDSDVYENSVG